VSSFLIRELTNAEDTLKEHAKKYTIGLYTK